MKEMNNGFRKRLGSPGTTLSIGKRSAIGRSRCGRCPVIKNVAYLSIAVSPLGAKGSSSRAR
jgi:hypothetical protein